MDYFELLHKAHMNNKNVGGQETRCYKATFTAPKKSEKSRVSSANIQRFLARKDEEEKQKQMEAQKKKEELLALRALDKKAQKRVQTMLKRTKSANKSVMEDAVDNYNTKDTLEGPQQCDEDDYGYVSQEASALYEKLMAKYEKDPGEKLKEMNREEKDLKATKDRVKAALDREAEEKLNPVRKRKRKHDGGESSVADEADDFIDDSEIIKEREAKQEEEEVKVKLKKIPKKMPPPVDFFELMKIAAKKQHEPIMIETKVEEPERPMTMKEKLEKQRELEREQERKNRKLNPKAAVLDKSSSNKSSTKEVVNMKSSPKNGVKIPSERSEPSKSKSIIKSKSDMNSNTIPSQSTLKKEVKFVSAVEKSPILSSTLLSSKGSSLNGYKNKNSGSVGGESKSVISSTCKPSLPSSKSNTKGEGEIKKDPPKVDVSDIDREIEMLMKKKKMLMEAAKSQPSNQKPTLPAPKQSLSSEKGPAYSQKDPVSSQKDPVSSQKGPVSSQKGPISSQKGPVSSQQGPVSSQKGPISSQKSLNKNVPSRSDVNLSMKKQSIDVRNDFSIKGSTVERDRLQGKIIKSSEPKPGFTQPQKRFPPHSGPPKKLAPPLMKKKKRVIDSESEYDSELDDFIDDEPDESIDYSRHIKEIFGYDKSRYSAVDEDECEESSYRTQMIEERRSAKIGLMEDLEDIQREKEEKARAKARKKAMMRR